MKLKNHQVVSALQGVQRLIALDLKTSDEKDAKSLHFPFKVQYRLGRMAEALLTAARIIERVKFARALDAAPGAVAIAARGGLPTDQQQQQLTPIQNGMIEDAALAYLDEDVDLDDPWVQPIAVSELGVPVERLTHFAGIVRDMGPLLTYET